MLSTIGRSAPSLRALRLMRFPGEFGPILRCGGELSIDTAEALRRELALLEPLGHRALIVDLSACSEMDVYGLLTLLQSYEKVCREGRYLAVVARPGHVTQFLAVLSAAAVLPVFSSVEAAEAAVRESGQCPPGPATWSEAREQSLARWRVIREALGKWSPEETMRLVTSMFGFCARAEELIHALPPPHPVRCRLCPVFYELGGHGSDLGCRSMVDPILAALRAHDLETAEALVQDAIRTLERMALPDEEELTPIKARRATVRRAA